jgi:hypothetical protein
MRSLLICNPHQKSRKIGWAVHVALWRRAEVCTDPWWGNPRSIDHLEDPDVDERIILR